jgi:RNA polymerase sigma-70 factor, ECF subfamily
MAAAEARRTVEAHRVEAVDDDELIGRVVGRGDRAAFDLLYERYFPRVYAFVARRLSNRADVEEAVQEVFFGVFAGLASFRGEGAFAAWLLGIARRTVAGRFKKRQHVTVPLDEISEAESIDLRAPGCHREATPLEHYECGERLARLQATAERELNAEQRRLFELHHLEHVPIDQLANLVEKSPDSVKSNLYRARRMLLSG